MNRDLTLTLDRVTWYIFVQFLRYHLRKNLTDNDAVTQLVQFNNHRDLAAPRNKLHNTLITTPIITIIILLLQHWPVAV